MGITIHYRGRLADPARLELFEDVAIDLVLALGGRVELWRSANSTDSTRMVRGLLVNLEPGQETMSLLFSPEGWITPLIDIEAAELGTMPDDTWCSIKTQFGTPVGHVAVIELLGLLRDVAVPDLEVRDETEYWQHRDLQRMTLAFETNAAAIRGMAAALEQTSLSSEAMEDPEIIAARVERIAQLVQQQLHRKPTLEQESEEPIPDFAKPWPQVEAEWQELTRQSEAITARYQRELEEELLKQGEEAAETSDASLFGDPKNESSSDDPFADYSTPFGERPPRDPLLERATEFYMALMQFQQANPENTSMDMLRHAGDLCGGLAQALPLPMPFDSELDERGLASAQLKRALRGAAFVRGCLLNLPIPRDGDDPVTPLRKEVEEIATETVGCLQQLRQY